MLAKASMGKLKYQGELLVIRLDIAQSGCADRQSDILCPWWALALYHHTGPGKLSL